MARRKCILRCLFSCFSIDYTTVFYSYCPQDWLTSYTDFTFFRPDPPMEVKYKSATNSQLLEELMEHVSTKNPEIYKELIDFVSTRNRNVFDEIINLVSPKDPKCQSKISTSDPFSNFDTVTAINLAYLLLSYRQQHIRWRKLLLEGHVESIRTLTWYCDFWCGGLGDRVRGIGFSLMLAMVSNRMLLVQWRQPFEVHRQKNIFEPAAIDWDVD